MSGVWSWFGGQSAQKRKDTPKNAILGLRAQLDMLQKREKHLQSQMDEQDAIARQNVSTNKNKAKAALKRKKQHEHILDQTVAQISTLEQQIYSIEAANINKETFQAMQNASAAMKAIHGNINIDKIDETMDQIRDQHAIGEEIANAITSAPIGEPVDEDELDEELAELEQEQLDAKMVDTGRVPSLPAAANGTLKHAATPVQAEDDEEEELRKLQAEMAM